MSQKVSLNGTFGVTGFNTVSVPMQINLTTSGSNVTVVTPNISSSWQILDQGSNKDFFLGVFKNMDVTQSIYIAQGGTGSYAALLTPSASICLLTNSGSTTLWAKSSAGTPQLNYTLVSNT